MNAVLGLESSCFYERIKIIKLVLTSVWHSAYEGTKIRGGNGVVLLVWRVVFAVMLTDILILVELHIGPTPRHCGVNAHYSRSPWWL